MTDFHTLIREARSGNAIADQCLLDSLADAIQQEQIRADQAEAALAEAWDEGYDAGAGGGYHELGHNPYRFEATS